MAQKGRRGGFKLIHSYSFNYFWCITRVKGKNVLRFRDQLKISSWNLKYLKLSKSMLKKIRIYTIFWTWSYVVRSRIGFHMGILWCGRSIMFTVVIFHFPLKNWLIINQYFIVSYPVKMYQITDGVHSIFNTNTSNQSENHTEF